MSRRTDWIIETDNGNEKETHLVLRRFIANRGKCLWGHNSVISSSITVNDSLDCLHRPYGHGAKIKNKKILRMIFWPRYCEHYEKFPVNFLQHDNEAFAPVNDGSP